MRIDPSGVPRLRSYAEAKEYYESVRPWKNAPVSSSPYGGYFRDQRPLSSTHRRKVHLKICHVMKPGITAPVYAVQLYNTDLVTYHADGRIEVGVYGWNTQSTRAVLASIEPSSIVQFVDCGGPCIQDLRTGELARTSKYTILPDGSITAHVLHWPMPYEATTPRNHTMTKHVRDFCLRYRAAQELGAGVELAKMLETADDLALHKLCNSVERHGFSGRVVEKYAAFVAGVLDGSITGTEYPSDMCVWMRDARARYLARRVQDQKVIWNFLRAENIRLRMSLEPVPRQLDPTKEIEITFK